MRTYRYLHYDVFTDRAFEGNQLAVFPEPSGLTADEMQTITREMSFSECTFIFPSEAPDTHVRMRIFTPGQELPMAGHPTIGSTFALVEKGTIARGQRDFVFGLGVGPTPVSLDWSGDTLAFAWMTQQRPQFGAIVPEREAFCNAIGISASDLLENTPIESVSCGVPFLFAALASPEAVDRVSIDRRQYSALCRAAGLEELGLFVFALSRAGREESFYSRMLAPGLGVAEDPATGSGSGPLGGYAAKHRLVARDRLQHMISLQGVAMKRPSRVHISLDTDGDTITRVRVGGSAVLVGDGAVRF
jgi:trans-2,3-dihydro-3-hydroxyanthranilate isomerase